MSTPEKRTLAELLKAVRQQRGLTQTQLASRIFSTPQCVQRWERDENSPKASTVERLCEALDIEPNYLFGYHCETGEHPRVKYYREKLNRARRALN